MRFATISILDSYYTKKEVAMAKFIQIGRKSINLDNVDYIDMGKEGNTTATIYFGGSENDKNSIKFAGDEANELWEKLIEEEILGTSAPRP
jgi:hypothetical protein